MPPARKPALVEEEPRCNDDPIAAGLRDLASAIREGTETFRPAAETVHGFGDRLDALCDWLRSKKTWGVIFLVWLITTYAPADLAEGLAPLIRGLVPAG